MNTESVVDDEAFISGSSSVTHSNSATTTSSMTNNGSASSSGPVYASVQPGHNASHGVHELPVQNQVVPPVPPLLPLTLPPSLLPPSLLPPPLPVVSQPITISAPPNQTAAVVGVVSTQPGVFRPKVLTTRELSHAVEQVLRENIKLGEEDKRLIARMYDAFRNQVAAALVSQDHAIDKFFWVELLGNMMVMAATFKTSGLSKKEIILETLRIIVKFEVPADREEQSIHLIETILSPAIDLTIYFKNQIASGKKCAWCLCFQ